MCRWHVGYQVARSNPPKRPGTLFAAKLRGTDPEPEQPDVLCCRSVLLAAALWLVDLGCWKGV